jgi:hypothetical protein
MMCLELGSFTAAYIQRAQVDITRVDCGEAAGGGQAKKVRRRSEYDTTGWQDTHTVLNSHVTIKVTGWSVQHECAQGPERERADVAGAVDTMVTGEELAIWRELVRWAWVDVKGAGERGNGGCSAG